MKEIILASVEAGKGNWSEITEAIRDAGKAPENWMVARGALQELINAGAIERTKDYTVEEYRMNKQEWNPDAPMFKGPEDFAGFWMKNVKNFQGHEGEPLSQGSVYYKGKKVGFYSDDSHGGPARLDMDDKDVEKILLEEANKYCGDEWGENYSIFFSDILDEVERFTSYKRKCAKKTLIRLEKDHPNEYRTINASYAGANIQKIREHLDKKYGKGKYLIINDKVNAHKV